MNKFTQDLHPKNKLILFLGNMENNSFNIDLGEKLQEEIVEYFKQKSIKNIHQQCKYYYHDDMKYIITYTGNHKCMKNKIHRYSCTNNLMINSVQEIIIPIDNFPPITTYHDTRIIEQSVFYLQNFSIEIIDVVYHHGLISHECSITIHDWNDKFLQEFFKKFNYNINFKEFIDVKHTQNNVLSII